MQEVVFDIEVYPRWWCIVYSNPDDMSNLEVITSEYRDYIKIIKKLIIKRVLIGFNVKGYDLRILNAIVDGADAYRIYELSKAIINDTEDVYNNYYYWNKFNFSDLYDDYRFGSLKEFESNSGMPIVECSIPFDQEYLTLEEKIDIVRYCKHDVKATIRLLESRRNYVDAKIAMAELFNIPLHTAYKSTNAKLSALVLKAKATYRPRETMFIIPEKVTDYIHSNLPEEVISMFDEIKYDNEPDDKPEVILFGNKVKFGAGGLHSTLDDNILVKRKKGKILILADVISYYPFLMMVFDYLSRNVKNPSIYKELYALRREFKKQMKTLDKNSKLYKELNNKQLAIKLILNTTYGATNNKYNALYDPFQATSVCYLGQLLLASLANELYNKTGATIVQSNTDGLLIYADEIVAEQIYDIIKEWEKITGLFMEIEDVEMFFQRDVNNYIEVKLKDGKYKYNLKGKWTNQAKDGFINNLNAPITHVAILNYYVKNKPVRETIWECEDLIDFCFTAKTGHTYDKTYYQYNDEYLRANKINRVVATTDKRCGTVYKFKDMSSKLSSEDPKTQSKIEDFTRRTGLDYGRLDKIAEIPDQSKIVNEELFMIPDLDIDWYVSFTENKIKELRVIE